jgi:hypothetical protein
MQGGIMQASQSSGDRLEQLRRRQALLRDQVARELVRQQKKNEREEARINALVGQTLIRNAAANVDFELMLKGILKSATSFNDSEKKLLQKRGWL